MIQYRFREDSREIARRQVAHLLGSEELESSKFILEGVVILHTIHCMFIPTILLSYVFQI